MKKYIVLLLTLLLAISGCTASTQTSGNESTTQLVSTESQQTESTSTEIDSSESEALISVTDALGTNISLENKPTRVVCLYASYADLWHEAGGELVGVIEASTLPEVFVSTTKVGKMSTPNIEAILALEPDLLIINQGYDKHEDLIPIFKSNKIPVYAATYNDFNSMSKVYRDFCAFNQNEALYEQKLTPLKTGIDALKANPKAFSYLLLFSTSKTVSAKDDNITAEIIDGLGGKNIATDYKVADEESKQLSLEKILEVDPDYIFVQTMGSIDKAKERLDKDVYSNPAWQSLSAVKNKKFFYLPKDLFLYKPNMKYLEAYNYMNGILVGKISGDE